MKRRKENGGLFEYSTSKHVFCMLYEKKNEKKTFVILTLTGVVNIEILLFCNRLHPVK